MEMQPLEKQGNGLVASSLMLFTHNEQAPVEIRVEIDSDDDNDWWKHLDPNDTVEQKVVEEIKSENMIKTKQRKVSKNNTIKVPKYVERKSVENNTNLSINNQYKPYHILKKRPKHGKELIEENKNHFRKEESNGDKIPLPPDRLLSDVVTVSTKSQPANTYENPAPNVTQNSCLTPPSQPLNTTDHCHDRVQHINYNILAASLKSCFEALKDRPDSFLEMTCEDCSNTFKNDPVLFKRHLTYYHNTMKKKVYIEPDISPEHVRLVARSRPTIVPREPSDIDHCLRLAIENACSIQPTEDLTILSYKCYICLQSWEHYFYFRRHMLLHLVAIVIKTENLMRDRHLFVHVVADTPEKAVEDRNLPLQLYSETGSRIYKCFKCDKYCYDKEDQIYHEIREAACVGCRIEGDCVVIKKHENQCAQFFSYFIPRTCQCGTVLYTKRAVSGHRKACSLGNSVLVFHCNVCGHRTLTVDFLRAHMEKKHVVRSDAYVYQPTVKCDMCDQHYAGPREQHVCTKHEYCPCSACGQLFENSTLLACHVKAYNESVICKQCPGTLQLEKGCLMTEHEIVHHTSDRMIVHACMYCSKMFSTHLHLKMHLLNHNKIWTKLVYKWKKIFPFKKDISVKGYTCFYVTGIKISHIAENYEKVNSYTRLNMVANETPKITDVIEEIGEKNEIDVDVEIFPSASMKQNIKENTDDCKKTSRFNPTTDNKLVTEKNAEMTIASEGINNVDVKMFPSDSVEENIPENTDGCKKNSNVNITPDTQLERKVNEEMTIKAMNNNSNIENVHTKDCQYMLPENFANSSAEITAQNNSKTVEEIKVEQDEKGNPENEIPNMKKNITKDSNELLPENSVRSFDAIIIQNNNEIVKEEHIVEQNILNIVKKENLNIKNTNIGKNDYIENSTNASEAITEKNNSEMADRAIQVEQGDDINVELTNLRIHNVFSINSNEWLQEQSEISHNTINMQYEIVNKIVYIEKNTTENIPLGDQKPDEITVLENKLETENTGYQNISTQECTKNARNFLTDSIMQTDEVEKNSLSIIPNKKKEQVNSSRNVHYEEIYSVSPEVVVKKETDCEESNESSDFVENKETNRDLDKIYMELIRAISDDGVSKEEKTDYVIEITQNVLATQSNTPIHVKTSEIVQEELQPHMATSSTKVKLEINEQPYDGIDAEDVIIFKKAAKENEMSELTIDQFILNNSEVTMPEIKPEELLNDAFESDTTVKKKYHCKNCDFIGIHRLYKKHKKSCKKSHPRRKKGTRTSFDLKQRMNKYQIKECSKCDDKFENLRDYLLHLKCHKLKRLQCPVCNLVQQSLVQYQWHVWRHLKMSFIRTYSIRADQTKTSKLFKCTKCKKIMQRGKIRQHWESHLQIGDKIKKEPEKIRTEPNTMTPYIKYLVTILMIAPQRKDDRELLRSCQVCDDRKFSTRPDMKRHIIQHLLKDALFNKVQNGNLKCQICQQGIEKIDSFKMHMREHAGLSLYQCNLCNKAFSDSSNFAKHKKVHNLKVLFCDICNKKYHTKKMLEEHLTHHNGSVQLKCEHCDKKFFFASGLNKHLKVRHKTEPLQFRCLICCERFPSRKLKWNHEWEVHKERKIKADCPICNEQFRKFNDVKQHVKKQHHGINLDRKIYHLLEKINEAKLPIHEIENILLKRLESGPSNK